MTQACLLTACLVMVAAGSAMPQTPGLDVRPAYCGLLPRPTSDAQIALVRAFSPLLFSKPVAFMQAPGDNQRYFVVEQTGQVKLFTAGASQAQTFADLTSLVYTTDPQAERGLLGMAFHPNYQTNRLVYFSYTTPPPQTSIIARYQVLPDFSAVNPASGQIILSQVQPFNNHNGGNIAFGPDGYLYLGLGDGGSGGDPNNNAQNTHTLLGAMLRLDVNSAFPYAIPPDNPFASSPACGQGGGCPELYAWGLRNPWRWSFDSLTGDLWVGDVGQNRFEEVDLVRRGDNLGWRCYEANVEYNILGCEPRDSYVFPVWNYSHPVGGCSITGGFVYRGTTLTDKQGVYFYGDYCSGMIWGLSDLSGLTPPALLVTAPFNISSFGQDNAGELYVLDLGGGGVYQLADAGTPQPVDFPQLLSQTGYFNAADPSQPADCLIPFDVIAPLWSDGATKRRWFTVPDGALVSVAEDGDFLFPPGTVLAKEFSLNGQRVETRLFTRHADGGWAGYSYEWATQSDASLVAADGKNKLIGGVNWRYPSRSECLRCHTRAANFALGPEIAQLNSTFTYPSTGRTANQLLTLDHIGLFSGGLPAPLPILPSLTDPSDTAASLLNRTRSYLHANCSGCHRPGGTGRGLADFRFSTPIPAMNACGVPPSFGDLGVTGALILSPGSPGTSLIPLRMNRRDDAAMPPLATSAVDTVAVNTTSAWIASLVSCAGPMPWLLILD